MFAALLFAVFIAGVFSDPYIKTGQCPEYPGFEAFEATKGNGQSYLNYLTPHPSKEFRCVRVEALYSTTKKSFEAQFSYYEDANPKLITYKYTAPELPNMDYKFNSSLFFLNDQSTTSDFRDLKDVTSTILDQNENYTLSFSCINLNSNQYRPFAFIYSPTPILDDTFLTKARETFSKVGLDGELKKVDNTNC